MLTFSYDKTPGAKKRQGSDTLDRIVEQVVEIMDAAGVEKAALCGVSFGGFIATRFAARYPDRTNGLILVSSPTPHWKPNEALLKYMERPLLSMPLVLPAWFLRMWPEIFAAKPTLAFGTPGGDQQDQWQLPFFLRYAHHGKNLQAAIDAPLFHTTHFPGSFYPRTSEPGHIMVEAGFGEATIAELRRRGHQVTVAENWTVGRLTAARRDADGLLRAAATPRLMQAYAVGR